MVTVEEMTGCVALPEEHRELVCRFLLVFSRCEAAVKRAGYAQQDGQWLIVEWRRFAREAGVAAGIPVATLGGLVNHPPAREQVVDHHLEFVPEAPPGAVSAEVGARNGLSGSQQPVSRRQVVSLPRWSAMPTSCALASL